jgi:hypothetical protein
MKGAYKMTTKKSQSKAAKSESGRTSQEPATSGDFVARQTEFSEHISPRLDVVGLRSPRRGAPRRQARVEASHRSTLVQSEPDTRRQPALEAHIAAIFRWRIAIEKAESGDVSGIIKLLSSGQIVPPECQALLADLLDRRQLTKKRGRQRRPIYESTPEERSLEKAAYLVRGRQREGVRFEDALGKVARNRNIEANKLGNFIQGKGSRRSRRRKSIPAAKREICGR